MIIGYSGVQGGDGADGLFVGEDAGDGHPRGIVDADMDIFPTDPARVALTLAVARCPLMDCTAIHERG